MNREALRDDTAFLTSASTAEYSSSDKNTNINNWYRQIIAFILATHDYFDFQEEEAYADLTANQAEYAFPADILAIKRVRVKLDGNWRVAKSFDPQETGEPLDATSVTEDFKASNPFYEVRDTNGVRYIKLYPAPTSNVTAGIYIYYKPLNVDMTLDTQSPSFAEPFHRILSYGASYDWAVKTERFALADRLRAEIERMKIDLKDFYAGRDEHRSKYMKPTTSFYRSYEI